MFETINLYLGFDPGGVGSFGWSVCREVGGQLEPPIETGLADNAWDALNRVGGAIADIEHQGNARVLAAGIDAPLFWTGTGQREIDVILRQALRDRGFPPHKLGGTVQAINSLQGSCVIQGPLLVRHFWASRWSGLLITESHPRVLDHLLPYTEEYQMAQRITAGLDADTGQNHERDATLCAVSAWAAIHQPANWQNLYQREPNPITPFDAAVGYWMPVPPPAAPA